MTEGDTASGHALAIQTGIRLCLQSGQHGLLSHMYHTQKHSLCTGIAEVCGHFSESAILYVLLYGTPFKGYMHICCNAYGDCSEPIIINHEIV